QPHSPQQQETEEVGRTKGTPRISPPTTEPRSTTWQRVTRWQFGHKSAMSAIPLISSWWGRGCRCGKGGAAERHCPGNILCRQPAPVNKKRGLPTLAPSPLYVYVSPLTRAQSQAPSFWTATMPPDAHPTDPARTADTAPPPPEIDRDTLHAFL